MFDTGLDRIFEDRSCAACREGNHSECEYIQEANDLNRGDFDAQDFIYISPRCACFLASEAKHWEGDYTEDKTWRDNVGDSSENDVPEILDPPFCANCMGTRGLPECEEPLSHAVRFLKMPTKQRPGDQQLPTGGGQCVQDAAIASLEAAIYQLQQSKKVGQERYGSVLKTFNGRRGIQDVLEEARDLFVYLTQVSLEVDASADDLKKAVIEALEQANATITSVYLADSATVVTVANLIVSRILTGIALRKPEGQE